MAPSNWQTSLKHAIDVDPRKIPLIFPTRTALLVLIAVAVLTLRNDANTQITVAIGITFAGLIDAPDEIRTRAFVLVRAGIAMVACATIGMIVANNGFAQVIVAALLAAVLGYIGILGPRMAVAGVLSLVLFCVYAGTPERGWGLLDTSAALAAGIALYLVVAFATTPLVAPLVRVHSVFPHFEVVRFGDSLRKFAGMKDAYTRHAIRLACAVSFATVISLVWHFPHSYWIPMTVVWISRPDLDGTVSKTMYRVIGTILGVGVCLLLFGVLTAPIWVVVLVVAAGTWVVTAFLWVNYSIAVIGITAEILALFLLDGQDIGQTAPWRMIATILAGIIVVLASYVWRTKAVEAT